MLATTFAAALLASTSAATNDQPPRCQELSTQAPTGWTCLEGTAGTTLGPSATEAGAAMAGLEQARERYKALTGLDAPPALVVSTDAEGQNAPIQSLRERYEARPFPYLVESLAWTPQRPDGTPGMRLPIERSGFVAHEIGHGFCSQRYAFFAPAKGARGIYGSTGPDWFDEGCAMLLGGDLERNVAHFARSWRRDLPPVVSGNVTADSRTVAAILAQEHPVAKIDFDKLQSTPIGQAANPGDAVVERQAGSNMVSIVVRTNLADRPVGLDPAAAALTTYLIDRVGERGLDALWLAMAKGETLPDYLARTGAAVGLPASLSALEADFAAWATARFGPRGATRTGPEPVI